MNKNGKEKESHSMGLRLDAATYHEVTTLSETLGLKRSHIIKMAIHRLYAAETTESTDRVIIFEKSTFRKMFASLENSEVETLAIHNAQNNIIKIRQRIMREDNDSAIKVKFNEFIAKFSMILSRKHWQWVENISTQTLKNGEIIMFINHDINAQFSLFLKLIFKMILNQLFDTEIIEEKTILAENQIELHFISPEQNN